MKNMSFLMFKFFLKIAILLYIYYIIIVILSNDKYPFFYNTLVVLRFKVTISLSLVKFEEKALTTSQIIKNYF